MIEPRGRESYGNTAWVPDKPLFKHPGAMMSGFEITRMILASCQPPSVHRSQIVSPCWRCSANQTSAECCREFTAWGGYQPLRAAINRGLGWGGGHSGSLQTPAD